MSELTGYTQKVSWSGRVVGVQPRIRLFRSFDQRHHAYQGYVLRIDGTFSDEVSQLRIAIGEGAQDKHHFRAGIEASGVSVPVGDPRLETATLYKTSGLKVIKQPSTVAPTPPPFEGLPPDLETYRSRGHRRLDPRTYETKCTTCIWGCRMPVEITVDHWNPSRKRYRFETFCYGPKSCTFYRAGATRKVPGRKGMTWEEADWVDEDASSHRSESD